MTEPLIIALDGPSGSGKSSVSRAVARALGIGYLDTGAMYRALTLWCERQGIDLGDRDAVAEAAQTLPLALGADPDAPSVELDGEDVAGPIRTSAISALVSQVATNTAVRAILQAQQRELMDLIAADTGGVVAEGLASPAGPRNCTAAPTRQRWPQPATSSCGGIAMIRRCRSSPLPRRTSLRWTRPTSTLNRAWPRFSMLSVPCRARAETPNLAGGSGTRPPGPRVDVTSRSDAVPPHANAER